MRRRRLISLLLVVGATAVVAIWIAAGGSGGPDGTSYTLELDNAFGLVPGSELRVAGVKAGRLDSMDVDPVSHRALLKIVVTQPGVGAFRSDVFCEARPQSLIGEYFVDCQPGKSRTELRPGSRIGVTHTASTIPVDLVQDMLRLPYRERLTLFVNELGGGLAGRGGDLNAAIRRGVPALREFDQVLAILAQQNRTLADLTTNADQSITALAANRRDVGRWIDTAGRAASLSAARSSALAEGFRRFPPFLEQLTPAMRSLGDVADAQTPALRNLSAEAPQLTRFLRDLGPFAEASRPALRSLGDASKTGLETIPPARSTVSLLRSFSKPAPELARNLAIVLGDINDRSRATEPDPRSPGGKGFTGLEALLEYVFNQSQAVNMFDQNGYILRASAFTSDCSPIRDAETFKKNYDALKHCSAAVGPTQPGITSPDPAGQPQPKPSAAVATSSAGTPGGGASAGPNGSQLAALNFLLGP